MIHLLETDPRSKSEPENFRYNHGSFSVVHFGLNNALKKLGKYAEPDDAEYVGISDGLNVGFKYKDKKSFVINVWETANTLPFFFPHVALERRQIIFGLSDQITNLWRKHGYPCATVYGGCDTDFWKPTVEKPSNDLVFCHVNSSNWRTPFDLLLPAFGFAFQGNQNVILKIKDTNESPKLKEQIETCRKKFNVRIELY